VAGCFEHGNELQDYIKFGDHEEAVMFLTVQNLKYVICGQGHVSQINDCRKQQQITVKLRATVTTDIQIANLPCVTP